MLLHQEMHQVYSVPILQHLQIQVFTVGISHFFFPFTDQYSGLKLWP